MPQLCVGCKLSNINLIHSQEDVLWLNVSMDDFAFSVQVI